MLIGKQSDPVRLSASTNFFRNFFRIFKYDMIENLMVKCFGKTELHWLLPELLESGDLRYAYGLILKRKQAVLEIGQTV